MMMSNFVRAGISVIQGEVGDVGDVRRCWCSNESNAPHSHYSQLIC
jgi:hypothetical protein